MNQLQLNCDNLYIKYPLTINIEKTWVERQTRLYKKVHLIQKKKQAEVQFVWQIKFGPISWQIAEITEHFIGERGTESQKDKHHIDSVYGVVILSFVKST